MKVTIKNWIEKEFAPGSRPSANTVRRWCINGDIPSCKIGNIWYVVEDDEEYVVAQPTYEIDYEATFGIKESDD